jgi:hypothetical protein
MKLKKFQREDFARLALHDGGVLGQDTGLGKGLAAYVWPLLKTGLARLPDGTPLRPITPAAPVLMVASGDLHPQITAEGLRHFGIKPTVLDCQETFLKLSQPSPASAVRILPPGFYLVTYTALSRNGVAQFPKLSDLFREANSLTPDFIRNTPTPSLQPFVTDLQQFYAERIKRLQDFYSLLEVSPADPLYTVRAHYLRLRKSAPEFRRENYDIAFRSLEKFTPNRAPAIADPAQWPLDCLTVEQQSAVIINCIACRHTEFSNDIGYARKGIKCVYSPTLADLCQFTFACVVCDEAVKIKAEDSFIGLGTRQMAPAFRLPMTATPIKNRLPDVFRLAHWATGAHEEATPRFPYGDGDRESFAEDFLVTERNLSAEARSESGRSFVRKTPQVCNVHRLWKFLAPIILRRSKKDCGEELVKMVKHVVRVPMGLHQSAVYRYHLEASYLDYKGRPAIVAKLQALRVAAANPCSSLLKFKPPTHKDKALGPFVSVHPLVPKLVSALTIIEQILRRREQFIVFSAFHDSLDVLSARLQEAGVRHSVLDGRVTAKRRGNLAALFKKGYASGVPGSLQGIECMSEGHSYPRCRNVILLAYSWAWDKLKQALDRIHRLDSEADVNVYVILCEGSIDRKLEGMNDEKGDAAELVLDGALLGEDPTEINFADLLYEAQTEFATLRNSLGQTGAVLPDEQMLEVEWPAIRAQLAGAMRHWDCRELDAASDLLPVNLLLPPMPAEYADLPLWQQAA